MRMCNPFLVRRHRIVKSIKCAESQKRCLPCCCGCLKMVSGLTVETLRSCFTLRRCLQIEETTYEFECLMEYGWRKYEETLVN